jgi:predicted kinase
MRVTVLIGVPGSGKSTWAASAGKTILSSDNLRKLLSGDETNQAIHNEVFRTMRFLLRERLRLGQEQTIIDATNIRRKDRKPFLRIAERFGAVAEAVFFDVPRQVALVRNASRSRRVPEAVVDRMILRLQRPSKEEGFTRIRTITG